MTDPRRAIPGVDRLLASPAFRRIRDAHPGPVVAAAIQRVQDDVRRRLGAGEAPPDGHDMPEWYAHQVDAALRQAAAGRLRPAINATGVVLHTNLGRAPLASEAIDAISRVAGGYANLEYDLSSGRRGSRYVHCADLLRELTGAEDALVVNNNAAALVLAVNTLARDREVVVSRGELVEIGDSFRIPEILERSGARVVEVGSTNRTHAADYERVLSDRTGVILKVHRSNFRMSGFVADVDVAELAGLAHGAGLALIHDLGSGLLADPPVAALRDEPNAAVSLVAGTDLVTMSGDKLLGGPQAGIVLGRAELVSRLRANPLCRAMRVDKLTLAALQATLMLYRNPERAADEIPALRMMGESGTSIAARAAKVADALSKAGLVAQIQPGVSVAGGGAAPDRTLPTTLVVLDGAMDAHDLAARLRSGDPPVVARIAEDRVVLDTRTVEPEQVPALLEAIVSAARAVRG